MVSAFESDASRGTRVGCGVEIVATRLAVKPAAARTAAALLSDAECHRASRLAFDRDRRRFVVARARLRQLRGARLDVRAEAVELVYGAHGKPALAPRFAVRPVDQLARF